MANTCMLYTAVLFSLLTLIFVILIADIEFFRDDSIAGRRLAYARSRFRFMEYEHYSELGGNTILSDKELDVNKLIMEEKNQEYKNTQSNPRQFKGTHNFLEMNTNISETVLFHHLKTMPKGAVLHVHDMAMCTIDFLIELCHRDNLWICLGPEGQYKELRFSRVSPTLNSCTDCEWMLLKQLRKSEGNAEVDKKLRQQFTLNSNEPTADINKMWQNYRNITQFVEGLLTYKQVWYDYFQRALIDFYYDGVQYVEVRSSLPELYDLDPINSTYIDTAYALNEISEDFMYLKPDFTGVKLIYAPRRDDISYCSIDSYLDKAVTLREKFPQFFAGFDMPGQEDGRFSLSTFAYELVAVQNKIDFYLQAGATNWYGTSADENIIDAVLLGAKRITHAFGLIKHPKAYKLMKNQKIAIELSPISNQMFGLLKDFRNHPAAHLLSNGFPLVIGSDSPGFWQAAPITHDFYITFVAIASKTADLGMLKRLAWNSIYYSAMDYESKLRALEMWTLKWQDWVDMLEKIYANEALME